MGRIKTIMIRKAASELFERGEGFGEAFDTNKKILNNTMPSKTIRNKVAGQISRLATQKRIRENERPHRSEERTEDEQ